MHLQTILATRCKTSETMKHNEQRNSRIKDQKHCWLLVVTTNPQLRKPSFSPTLATFIKFLQNKGGWFKKWKNKKAKWLLQKRLLVASHILHKNANKNKCSRWKL
jgi:hypothetical protein